MNDTPDIRITGRSLAILAATVGGMILTLGASWGSDGPAAFPPVTHAATQSECSACHFAYPAGLLPARSWKRMMGDLEHHFGEDASLSPKETADIARYLTEHAADAPGASLLMNRIATSIPAGEAPLRFTESRYFHYLHDEVPGYIWQRKGISSKSNCIACHTRADQGSFIEREIKIPKN